MQVQTSSRVRFYAMHVCVLAILAVLVFTLQWSAGVYRTEVGAHADEGGHFITGLMVHDYLLAKDHRSPLRFAENYYVHYPRVALGHWPPLFYVLQALWMLVFGAKVAAVHGLVGLLAVVLAFLLYRAVAARHGTVAGLVASGLMVATPVVAQSTGLIMADVLVALTALAATLTCARYLQTSRLRDAMLFAVFVVLALQTKGNAFSLAAVPVSGIMLARRWELLIRAPLWLAAVLVFALNAPWYWLTAHMALVQQSPSLQYATTALIWYSSTLFWFAGPLVGIAAIAGLVARVLQPLWRGLPVQPLDSCMVGLGLGTLAVACSIQTGLEQRYVLPVVPAVLFFATEGVFWAASMLPRLRQRVRLGAVALGAVAVLGFLIGSFELVKRADRGFSSVNDRILEPRVGYKPVILVGSDPTGENMMMSDLVQRESRPGHFILRAGKVLASQNWEGRDYTLRYSTSSEVMAFLDSVPVDYVIIDQTPSQFMHQDHLDLLGRAIQENPERWREVGHFPRVRDGYTWRDAIGVYEFLHPPSPTIHIRIDEKRMLHRDLEFTSPTGSEGGRAAIP